MVDSSILNVADLQCFKLEGNTKNSSLYLF